MPSEDLSFFQEEEFKNNLKRYEEMMQGGRSVYLEADELTDIAEYYLIKNRHDEAMQCIDYALRIHPDSVDPMIFLARQKMFSGELEAARKIRDCITDQNDREVIFLNAELLLREGSGKAAHDYLQKWGEAEDGEEYGPYAYDCACIFSDYAVWNYAETWNDIALQKEPDNEKFLKLKADILVATNRSREATGLLNRLLDSDPYNIPAWHTLTEAYFILEDYEQALDTIDFTLAIDEHDEYAMLMKADCRFHLQDYEEAHRLYTVYLNEHDNNELPCLFDGISLMMLERYEEALQQLLRAEELAGGYSSEQHHIYANLAETYSKLKQPEKAFEYVDKTAKFNADYSADLYRGHILLENNRREEALLYFDRYILQSNNSPDAHFFTAVSLTENQEYDEACKHFRLIRREELSDENNRNQMPAYEALCALMRNRFDEFQLRLLLASLCDPTVLPPVLGRYFPEKMPPDEYCQYALDHPEELRRFIPDNTGNQ